MFCKYSKYLCPSLSKFVHVFTSLVQVLSKFLSYNIPLIPWRFRLPPIVIAVCSVIAVLSYFFYLYYYQYLIPISIQYLITAILLYSYYYTISYYFFTSILYYFYTVLLLLRYRYIDITVIQSMI